LKKLFKIIGGLFLALTLLSIYRLATLDVDKVVESASQTMAGVQKEAAKAAAAKVRKEDPAQIEKRKQVIAEKAKVFVGTWAADVKKTIEGYKAEADDPSLDDKIVTPDPSSKLFGYSDLQSEYIVPWAFMGKKKKCGGDKFDVYDPDNKSKTLNEFDLRKLASNKESYKERLTGKLFKFHGSATYRSGTDTKDNGTVCVDIKGGNISGDIELCRKPYNFKKKRFDFIMATDDDFKSTINPKRRKANIRHNLGAYRNTTKYKFTVDVPEDQAEGLLKNMDFEVEFLLQPTGLSYHKKCKRECLKFLGVRDCGYHDDGYGVSMDAKVPRMVIKMNGKKVVNLNTLEKPTVKIPTSGFVIGLDVKPAKISSSEASGKATVHVLMAGKSKSFENLEYKVGKYGELTFSGNQGNWEEIEVRALVDEPGFLRATLNSESGMFASYFKSGDPKSVKWTATAK